MRARAHLAYANQHSIIHNPAGCHRVPHRALARRVYARKQARDITRARRAAPEHDASHVLGSAPGKIGQAGQLGIVRRGRDPRRSGARGAGQRPPAQLPTLPDALDGDCDRRRGDDSRHVRAVRRRARAGARASSSSWPITRRPTPRSSQRRHQRHLARLCQRPQRRLGGDCARPKQRPSTRLLNRRVLRGGTR